MAINPEVTDAVTIKALQQHPTVPSDDTTLGKIWFGVDSETGALTSYRLSVLQAKALMGVGKGVTYDFTEAGHSIPALTNGTIPRPVTRNGGVTVLANASSIASLQTAYVVKIPDANTITLQNSGPVSAPNHGLTLYKYYYLQTDGSITATPDESIDAPCWYVWDAHTLILQQLRPQMSVKQTIAFVDSLADMVVPGAQYRLRDNEIDGSTIYQSGLYFVDEDGTIVQLHVLPGV